MKILYYIPRVVDTALQITTENEFSRSLVNQGHYVETVVGYQEKQRPMEGFSNVQYYHIPKGNILRKIGFHMKMLIEAIKTDADVILLGYAAMHLAPLIKLFRRSRRAKIFMDIRSVPVDVKRNVGGMLLLFRYKVACIIADRLCDGITVITPMLGDTLRANLSQYTGSFGIWGSGVNLDQFQRAGVSLRGRLALEDKFVIFYHGVISPNRGIQSIVKAMPEIIKEVPNAVFLLVGGGEGRSEIERLAQDLELADRVIFTGTVPYENVPEYVRSADVGVLPFPNIEWWAVSSPIKLMEYLAMGIPVVATDIAANRFVLERTGGGALVASEAPSLIADCIVKVAKEKLEPADSEILENTISWNQQARQFVSYVNSLEA